MKCCKTCKYWGTVDIFKFGKDTERYCYNDDITIVIDDNGADDQGVIPILCTKQDFCCSLWKSRISDIPELKKPIL